MQSAVVLTVLVHFFVLGAVLVLLVAVLILILVLILVLVIHD